MAEDALVKILEAPLGINTVDSPKSARFQPGGEQPPFLARAENVDLDRTGGLKRRVGRTKVRALTNGHSGWACSLGAFYADGETLYRFDPRAESDAVIQTGLNAHAEISYEEVAGQVFWCNGHQTGSIVQGQARPWGLASADPPHTAPVAGGALRSGRYLIAVAPVANGVEGGCRQVSVCHVAEAGGIAVSPAGIDPTATALNVYLSDLNRKVVFYHSTVPVGNFTITSPAPTTELFTGLGAYPPPAGHLVRQWGGFLIVARSEPSGVHALYFSEPGNPHRFHLETDVQLLPSRCVMLEPMVDGFFYGLESGGTFWVSGTDPHNMQVRQIDDRRISESRNSLRVPASKLPWLQAQADVPVPIWVTQDGFAAGLPGGVVRYPLDGRVAMDASKQATVAYVERPSLRQLLMSAREKTMGQRIGFGDRVTVTVTRGGVPTT